MFHFPLYSTFNLINLTNKKIISNLSLTFWKIENKIQIYRHTKMFSGQKTSRNEEEIFPFLI